MPSASIVARCWPGSMERYELLKHIVTSNFDVTLLMRNKETEEVVAMKYIPWGLQRN